MNIHPNLNPKSFILFKFKVLTIKDWSAINIVLNKFHNSPFAFRPLALIAFREGYDNVNFIMKSIINPDTKRIIDFGFSPLEEHFDVQIIRFLLTLKCLVSSMELELPHVIFVQ